MGFSISADSAMMFIDLDGFKEINDRFRNGMRDKLLKVIADKLEGSTATQGAREKT